MYRDDTDLLFPMRVAPELRELRGQVWRELVDRALLAADGSIDRLAFTLLMVRLSSCLTCYPDSYRALRGCTLCAVQIVRRFRGEDQELVAMFEQAHKEISSHLENPNPVLQQEPIIGDFV
jgi:hypothetical protein